VLNLKRSSFYNHLNELSSSGWLLFSTDDKGVLSFEFKKAESKFLDSSPNFWTDAMVLINLHGSIDSKDVNHSNGAVQKNGQKVDRTKNKPRDPLLDHPAVKMYRRVMHLTANTTQRKSIAEKVIDNNAWFDALEHWAGHGWRPTNVSGMLDSYTQGGRENCQLCRQKRFKRKDPPFVKPNREKVRKMVAEARKQNDNN